MGEFTPYWQAVKDRFLLILLISTALAVVALMVARNLEPSHEVHFSYVVSLSERESGDDYTFDGYYALQATELFARTLARLVQTPEIIVQAHEAAGLNLQSSDPRQLSQAVRVTQAAPQLVEVTVVQNTAERATALTSGLQQATAQFVDAYHDEGIPALTFRIVPTESWPGVTRVAVPVIVVATFVFSFFIGINVVLLTESFSRT